MYAGNFYAGDIFGEAQGPTWMGNVVCNGGESKLTDCQYDGLGTTGTTVCTHSDDVGIQCKSYSLINMHSGKLEFIPPLR